jgi:K+/H+ antiporter YhaU regulatory subunit KhtT
MAKVKKLTKKELESVQEVSTKYSRLTSDVGNLELNKQDLLIELAKVRQEIEAEKSTLQKKYGDVNINLQTGEYSENKED